MVRIGGVGRGAGRQTGGGAHLEAVSRLETMSRACTGLRPAETRSCMVARPRSSSVEYPASASALLQFSSPTDLRKEFTSEVGASCRSASNAAVFAERFESMSFACAGLTPESTSSS